jgi:hypothetical protein
LKESIAREHLGESRYFELDKLTRELTMTWLHTIHPFTAVVMAFGFAIVASLMLAALQQ